MKKILALLLLSTASLAGTGLAAEAGSKVLARFDDIGAWQLITSPQVSGSLRPVRGNEGRALCLDYDFHDVSGYVGIRRPLEVACVAMEPAVPRS